VVRLVAEISLFMPEGKRGRSPGECQDSCRLIHATLADNFSSLGAKLTG